MCTASAWPTGSYAPREASSRASRESVPLRPEYVSLKMMTPCPDNTAGTEKRKQDK